MSPRAAWRLESLGFSEVSDYEGGKLDWLAFDLPVDGSEAGVPRAAAAMHRDAPTCHIDEPAAAAVQRMRQGGWTWSAVVNDAGVVLGRLRSGQAEEAAQGLTAGRLMEEGPSTYRPSVPAEELVSSMKSGGFELAFITDSSGRWLGLVDRQGLESLLADWRGHNGAT